MTDDRTHPFIVAFKESIPVGMGYIPLGMAFGLYAVSQGFQWWWAIVTAIIVYAGSMEFIAVHLMLGGASLLTSAITTFFVNFRHVFYGLSFPMRNIQSPLGRAYSIHALTDEAYALLSHPRAQSYSGPHVFWIQLLCHSYWVTGVSLGAISGTWIPWDLQWLDFTLVALFTVLSIDVLKASKKPLALLAIALICGGIALAIVPNYMVVAAMTAYAVIVAGGRQWLT